MILIERVTVIPCSVRAQFTKRSAESLKVPRSVFKSRCRNADLRVVYWNEAPIFVIGIDRGNFIAGREVWVLLCKAFRPTMLRRLLPLFPLLGNAIANIRSGEKVDTRFAEFFGMRPAFDIQTLDGTPYRQYEVSRVV